MKYVKFVSILEWVKFVLYLAMAIGVILAILCFIAFTATSFFSGYAFIAGYDDDTPLTQAQISVMKSWPQEHPTAYQVMGIMMYLLIVAGCIFVAGLILLVITNITQWSIKKIRITH